MNRAAQIIVGIVAVLVIVACLLLKGGVEVNRTRSFGAPHNVAAFDGTAYVVRLAEVTVGRVENGYVLMVYLSIENPNAAELVIDREQFVLADPRKNYHQPTTSGTQTPQIRVAPQSVAHEEMLSFLLGDHALEGGMILKIGADAWAFLKSARPYDEPLAEGQFRSFRTTDW